MNILGWVGDALLVLAVWFLANKKRWAFLLQAAGSFVWGITGGTKGMLDLVVLNLVFIVISLRGYVKWKTPTKATCASCNLDYAIPKPPAEQCKLEIRNEKLPNGRNGFDTWNKMFCSTHDKELILGTSNPFDENGNGWICPESNIVLARLGWQ